MSRTDYQTRKILLRTEIQRDMAAAAVRNAPLDDSRPLEFVLREEVKARKPDQNALMWVGPLADIAEQGYVAGRTFTAEVWHEHFKREYLPEEFDPELCKEGYRKWDYTPAGERVLVGSTTKLTIRGFALYLKQVEAYAQTELGVQFHANPKGLAA
ncbi:recombination protein NinB [Luteimonas saliphila]|uniref:recombination protein NinB n=1 Tax=Luteimonas saliphila TaxID=2804919 RepID=UPI00192DBF0A